MLEACRYDRVLDVAQPGSLEELRQLAFASARELRFIVDSGVELPGRSPEQAQRPSTAAMIPDACGDDTIPPGHTRHLGQPHDGI